MRSFKLNVQALLDIFRKDGFVDLTAQQIAVLLEAAARVDQELLQRVAIRAASYHLPLFRRARNMARLPSDMTPLPENKAVAWTGPNLKRWGPGSGYQEGDRVEMPRSLVDAVASELYRQRPDQLPVLPLPVLESLELSKEEISTLLGHADTHEQRQRLIQLAGRQPGSRPQSESTPKGPTR